MISGLRGIHWPVFLGGIHWTVFLGGMHWPVFLRGLYWLVFLRATIPIAASFRAEVCHNVLGRATLGHCHNARRSASCTNRAASDHLVDPMLGWVNRAWETVAPIPIAFYLDAESWLFVSERRGGFEIDWVPSELDERLASFDGIPTKYIGAPISVGLLGRTPYTTFFGRHPRWIDIETGQV